MKNLFTVTAVVLALGIVAPAANAKGCLKGAALGGVAGHYVGDGHGMLGAAAGCVVGHHYAKKHARQQMQQQNGRSY